MTGYSLIPKRYRRQFFLWLLQEESSTQSSHHELFGEGDTAIVTREVPRTAEKNPDKRPAIHVGG
jgi:hypothetical protein